jgi:hypothetical protein
VLLTTVGQNGFVTGRDHQSGGAKFPEFRHLGPNLIRGPGKHDLPQGIRPVKAVHQHWALHVFKETRRGQGALLVVIGGCFGEIERAGDMVGGRTINRD